MSARAVNHIPADTVRLADIEPQSEEKLRATLFTAEQAAVH